MTTGREKGGLQIDGDEDTDHKRSILKSGRSGRNRGTQIMMISAHLCGPPMSKMTNIVSQMKPVGDRLSSKTQLSIICDPPRSAKTAAKRLEPTSLNNTMVNVQVASKLDPFRVVQFSAPISNLVMISLSSAENSSGAALLETTPNGISIADPMVLRRCPRVSRMYSAPVLPRASAPVLRTRA